MATALLYAKSANIQALPISSDRATYDGRSLTEKNLTSLIASLIDTEGFVISFSETNTAGKAGFDRIDFCLSGYIFKLTDTDLIRWDETSTDNNLYVKLDYPEGIEDDEYKHLKSDILNEDVYRYEGLIFTTAIDEGDTGYFPLIVSDKIPNSSFHKFKDTSIASINGGIV